LVLDEATSALDSLMAQEVMKAVDKMRGERTILMVAHQITTIKDCDHIYILENGSLVDSGSYEELHYTGLDDAVVKVSR
jgi:ATP-binding cassette subfamily C protein